MWTLSEKTLQGAGVSAKQYQDALTIVGAMLAGFGLVIAAFVTSGGAPEPKDTVKPGIVAVTTAPGKQFTIHREGSRADTLTKKIYTAKGE